MKRIKPATYGHVQMRAFVRNALRFLCIALPAVIPTLALPRPSLSQTAPASQPVDRQASPKDSLENIDLFTLEIPTVVTASRRSQKVTTVPYAVSVITAADIRSAGARNIADALRLVPGMDVSELTYGNAAVSPRGLHGFFTNRALILVDGRQIFDSAFGGTLLGSWPFQLEDIERIEVIRGPGGVTWGANTTNGVINIITKDPIEQLGVTVTGMGGSRGVQKEHVGYGYADSKLRMRVSAEYEGSDGFRKGGMMLLGPLDDDVNNWRSNVHAVYEANDNDTFTISGGNSIVHGNSPMPALAGIGNRTSPNFQASFLMGKWQHQVANDNYFTFTGYVNDFGVRPGLQSIDYRYQQLASQFSHTFSPAENHTLTWGIDNRVDLVNASNSDPHCLTKDTVDTDIVGLYVQDQWKFAPRWAFDLGGRIDYDCYGGFQPSGRASLSYEVTPDSLVYAAISRAFAMPPAAQRFMDISQTNGMIRSTANRDLPSQQLIAYELGYRGKFIENLETSIDLYWQEYDNIKAIIPGIGPPGLMQANLQDDGNLSLYGVEIDARYRLTERIKLLGNYTYQQCDSRMKHSFHYTDCIYPPTHKFMVGSIFDVTDDLHLSAYLYYVDSVTAPNPNMPFLAKRIPQYFRLDLRAEYEFWQDRASIAVGVRNLLDPDHPEGSTVLLNDAEVPRMIYAEMRMTFK